MQQLSFLIGPGPQSLGSFSMTTDLSLLDDKQLRALFKEQVSHAIVAILPEYLADLRLEGDVEDKRKFLSLGLETVGWKEPPPKDPNSNLPMVNIVINIPDETGAPKQITLDAAEILTPSPALLASQSVNADIADVD
jgi:hypothetical protein